MTFPATCQLKQSANYKLSIAFIITLSLCFISYGQAMDDYSAKIDSLVTNKSRSFSP
jgi:hypothetical protein